MMISQMMLIIVIGAAAYTDIRFQRIPNKLALAGMAAGLASGLAFAGPAGAGFAAAGAAAGFGIMLLFYWFGAIGAGDVKLFAAVGSLGGVWLTLSIITYSILFAGVIGIAMLIYRKQLFAKGMQILFAVFSIVFLKQRGALVHSRDAMIRFPFLWAVIPGLGAALWELWDKGEMLWKL